MIRHDVKLPSSVYRYANVVFFPIIDALIFGHGLPADEPYATLLSQLKVSGDIKSPKL